MGIARSSPKKKTKKAPAARFQKTQALFSTARPSAVVKIDTRTLPNFMKAAMAAHRRSTGRPPVVSPIASSATARGLMKTVKNNKATASTRIVALGEQNKRRQSTGAHRMTGTGPAAGRRKRKRKK